MSGWDGIYPYHHFLFSCFIFLFCSNFVNTKIKYEIGQKAAWLPIIPICMCRMWCHPSQTHPRASSKWPYLEEKVHSSYKLQSKLCFLTCISLVTNDYLPVSWAENTHRFSFEVNLLDLKRFFF